ncbi:hypothetical protein [Staphylococcus epidermidis]|uniref:hypothetical protein n=1 Tax=Staphylococcus epidermidis TaxID=1282 RepID=UPI0021B3E349|nr:hypothetical protein [Staphylococcus epidermidis]
MAESDKEKILEYIKNNEDKLDYDGVFGEVMDTSEHSVYLTKRRALDIYSPTQLHTSKAMNKDELLIHELFKQCKSFKNQRDELINDMAEVKRKAEAWDKLKEYVLDRNETFSDRKYYAQSPQQFEYFESLSTAFKVIKTKMNDLERGSDGHN